MPLTIDFGSGLYFHPESGGLLLGAANPSEPSSFDQKIDEDFMGSIIEKAFLRVPALKQAELLSGWAGLYAITPDHNCPFGPF